MPATRRRGRPCPRISSPRSRTPRSSAALLGLTVLEVPGFEADDLIAALARRAPDAGFKVEVASSDKDLFQLVEDGRVAVWHPVKEMLLDAKGVTEEFGVPPNRVLDVLALMGDSSDNIPGVKGIGEKSARELVLAYGSLEDIYANLEQLKGKRKELLEAGKDSAFLSRKLASLAEDAPVGDVASEDLIAERFGVRKLEPADVKQLAAFYDELGFAKLKGDLLREHFADAGVVEAPPSGSSPEIPAARFTASPEEVLALAKAADRVALHVECAPGKPFPAEPLVAVVGLPGETLAFAPRHAGGARRTRRTLRLSRLDPAHRPRCQAPVPRRVSVLGLASARTLLRRHARGVHGLSRPPRARSRGRRALGAEPPPRHDPRAQGRVRQLGRGIRRGVRKRCCAALPRAPRPPSLLELHAAGSPRRSRARPACAPESAATRSRPRSCPFSRAWRRRA